MSACEKLYRPGTSTISCTNAAAARRVEDVQQLILRRRCRGREHVDVEIPADHRRQRQHPLGLRAQSPDTRPDDHQHRVGQCRQFERTRQHPPTIGILDDHLGLGQVTQQFGDEERIPIGLSIDRVGQDQRIVVEAHGPRGLPSMTRHQHCRGHRAATSDTRSSRCNAASMSRRPLGLYEFTVAIRAEYQQTHRLVRGRHVSEQLQTRRVGPLQVFQHHHHRLVQPKRTRSSRPLPRGADSAPCQHRAPSRNRAEETASTAPAAVEPDLRPSPSTETASRSSGAYLTKWLRVWEKS